MRLEAKGARGNGWNLSRVSSSRLTPSSVFQAHFCAEIGAVLVGLEGSGADAVGGELFVALLGVSSDADGAEDFAIFIADQHAAAFGKDLIVGGADQISH